MYLSCRLNMAFYIISMYVDLDALFLYINLFFLLFTSI